MRRRENGPDRLRISGRPSEPVKTGVQNIGAQGQQPEAAEKMAGTQERNLLLQPKLVAIRTGKSGMLTI